MTVWLVAICLLVQVRHEILIERHRPVTMQDGVRLYADVYRPRGDGKSPALVVRTPYGTQRDGVHATMIRFAEQGYAVVVQDVRGRYESDGSWQPFRHEADDGADTIAWTAAQPWCNGKVAMQGASYLGLVQWRAASRAPAKLCTIFPAFAATNVFANWITQGGAFRLSFNYGWGVVRMPHRIMLPQYWHSEDHAPLELKYETILRHLPLADGDLESSHDPVLHYREWLDHPSYDPYWRGVSDEESFGDIRVPVHTYGGWFDIFLAGTIDGFVGVRGRGATEQARRETKMTIGPWGHGPGQKFGDLDFGGAAARSLFDRELRWFDHYLKGVDNGIEREPPVEIFYMGANQWRHESDWPVPGTRFTPYYLSGDGHANTAGGDGRITATRPTATKSDQYAYDPNDPVPSVGGNNCCGAPTPAGPRDQRAVEMRADVLVYTSEPLEQPLTIAGPVTMKLFAATDGPDTDFVVKLVDVFADGLAVNVAEGILRARYHEGTDHEALLEPGRVYQLTIDLIGTANVFLPGHRLRVDVTSSHFPQFDRNPNTGEPFATSGRVRAARQTIWHGADHASHILLPVVPPLTR